MKKLLILLTLLISSCAAKNPIYEVLEDAPAILRDQNYYERRDRTIIFHVHDRIVFNLLVELNNNNFEILALTNQRFAAKDQNEAEKFALEVNNKKYHASLIVIFDETQLAEKYENVIVGKYRYSVGFFSRKRQ